MLVEATNRILPEVGPDMGAYAARQLDARGIDLRLGTRLESCVDGRIVLSDGDRFQAETLVWTAGVKPSPMLDRTDLPRGPRGHITALPTLQVVDGDRVLDGAWTAGDCAQVPDLTNPGAYCSPSAQHAVRQAAVLADNIRQVILGGTPKEYQHKYAGQRRQPGPAQGRGAGLRHQAQGPARVVHAPDVPREPDPVVQPQGPGAWPTGRWRSCFKRETISLGQLHRPREEFTDVTPPLTDRAASRSGAGVR